MYSMDVVINIVNIACPVKTNIHQCCVLSITGVTVVLTMCFMNIDNRRDIPKVSYSTALDYFVGACFTFVFASIIQFSGVHYFTKHGSGEIIHDPDSDEDDEFEV